MGFRANTKQGLGMHHKSILRRVLALIAISVLPAVISAHHSISLQNSLEKLESKLKVQYLAIEKEIGSPPSRVEHPADYRVVLREWQDRLASRFTEAASTVEAIMQLDTANADKWRERLETLRVYGQPISSPGQRSVFGQSEVKKPAKVISAPAAVYTDAARAEDIRGDVRLRLILSADGSVKNIFPIKSLPLGLTESAMDAARRIQFEPAVRDGQPVSQFATFVYDFRNGDATPHIPRTVF